MGVKTLQPRTTPSRLISRIHCQSLDRHLRRWRRPERHARVVDHDVDAAPARCASWSATAWRSSSLRHVAAQVEDLAAPRLGAARLACRPRTSLTSRDADLEALARIAMGQGEPETAGAARDEDSTSLRHAPQPFV